MNPVIGIAAFGFGPLSVKSLGAVGVEMVEEIGNIL